MIDRLREKVNERSHGLLRLQREYGSALLILSQAGSGSTRLGLQQQSVVMSAIGRLASGETRQFQLLYADVEAVKAKMDENGCFSAFLFARARDTFEQISVLSSRFQVLITALEVFLSQVGEEQVEEA
jgi:hypothetical protein